MPQDSIAARLVWHELPRLTDSEMLDLHREVSRRAQAIRAADPVYQSHYKTGVAAARARDKRAPSCLGAGAHG